jgi:esterase/lipase superfamily enzyme
VEISHHQLHSHAIGSAGAVYAYTSAAAWGRPVLAFPAEAGHAWDWQDNGMVDAVAGLIEASRIKLFCVDSFDAASWSNRSIPIEDRAREHGRWESWVLDEVVPFVHAGCGGHAEIVLAGASLGAFHAANLALKRADLFPLAICMSGSYDPSRWHGWGERGEAAYFNNPMDYVAQLGGDHLDWLRERLSLLLVVGQGMWEDTTGSLRSTHEFADLLRSKGLRVELDAWGNDVPHDWPSWRAQLAHHLPRFC